MKIGVMRKSSSIIRNAWKSVANSVFDYRIHIKGLTLDLNIIAKTLRMH